MNASAPVVSVIVPTCNRLEFLREAVASVLAQTFTDWELVVADDGSDAATCAWLRSVESAGARILWLSHTGNPARVRNAALRVARGTYVAFLDSDDLWHATKLERQLEMLARRPECGWSYTAFRRVSARGEVIAAEQTRRWTPEQGWIFAALVRTQASIRTPSVVVRNSLLAATGTFDETLQCAEDYDLWLRMALVSPIALVDEPLVDVRMHDRNHSSHASGVFESRDYSLAKLETLAPRQWRRLLRRERGNNALLLAREHSSRNHHARALAALGHGFPYGWPYGGWWLGAAKTLLWRYLMPSPPVHP